MGTIIHKSLIVTTQLEDIEEVQNKAKEMLGEEYESLVSDVVRSVANGFASFFIATSGSKLGWETYEEVSIRVKSYADWLYDMGFEYVYVEYGRESYRPNIIESSNE